MPDRPRRSSGTRTGCVGLPPHNALRPGLPLRTVQHLHRLDQALPGKETPGRRRLVHRRPRRSYPSHRTAHDRTRRRLRARDLDAARTPRRRSPWAPPAGRGQPKESHVVEHSAPDTDLLEEVVQRLVMTVQPASPPPEMVGNIVLPLLAELENEAHVKALRLFFTMP